MEAILQMKSEVTEEARATSSKVAEDAAMRVATNVAGEVSTISCTAYLHHDDDNKPVWPPGAVGVLSGAQDIETYVWCVMQLCCDHNETRVLPLS
jgi:4'-phosphopantetheinyl transferase EntD